MTQASAATIPTATRRSNSRMRSLFRYIGGSPALIVGLVMLSILIICLLVGAFVTNPADARPLAYRPSQPPSLDHWMGTDRLGKDILTVMVVGTPLTLWIGLLAGTIGVVIGTLLAFFAGYLGGAFDTTVNATVDILRTVPPLLVLIVIAISVPGHISVTMMALIVAALSWLGPTRLLRSQVLVIKQQSYVEMARFTGMNAPEIIIKEMMPNMMPFIVAVFVSAISGAILASIGLEALGLGPFESNTLGMTIYWNIWYGSLLNGWWWWWSPPIAIIVYVFIGLFLVSQGLDAWANPRLRKNG